MAKSVTLGHRSTPRKSQASGLSEQIITRASDVPQAIPRGRNRIGGGGGRGQDIDLGIVAWGDVGLPRREVSSLSLKGFTLRLETVPASRSLGKGFRV